MPTSVVIGLLKVSKHNFGPDPANRVAEFGMAVQQANAILKSQQRGGIRVLVAPEYYWSGFGEIGKVIRQQGPLAMDRAGKHDIYKALKKISGQAGSLVLVAGSIFYQKPDGTRTAAFNVCPVLRNGRFLLKSYKEFDDGASGKNAGTLSYDQKDSDPYFKVDGVGFGLEVCGDHNDQGGQGGRLKRWNAAAGKTIDIHLLVSDSMTVLGGSVAARAGGYLVQCDIGGTTMGIAVYPAGGAYSPATASPAIAIGGTQVNGASVHCYRLEV